MIKIRKIAHATFETPDLEKAVDYYTQVNGLALADREKGRAFLVTRTGLLSVQLEQASRAHCARLAFELAPNTDFSAISRQLSSEGIRSEERHDVSPGIPNMLSFLDPNGTVIELLSEWKYLSAWRDGIGIGPLKLGHVAFFVPDPKLIAEFYQSVLGFRVLRLDRRFFRIHAVQPRSPLGQFRERRKGAYAPYCVRAERHLSYR